MTERLQPFVGEWDLTVSLGDARAWTTFEWELDGRYLLQRAGVELPEAPDALCVIAPDGDDFTQHYFDSRGVVRLYAMTFDGTRWTLERHAPDFSPLPFHQRFTGDFSAGGARIDGRWEISPDGQAWELDFELTYTRQR